MFRIIKNGTHYFACWHSPSTPIYLPLNDSPHSDDGFSTRDFAEIEANYLRELNPTAEIVVEEYVP